MDGTSGRYPGRAPIDASGSGGFRFAGMSHRGSILCLAEAIVAWPPTDIGEVDEASLAPLLVARGNIDHLILGTGRTFALVPADVRSAMAAIGIRVESMDTGAACRTYNILLGEHRPVAAALIAVT